MDRGHALTLLSHLGENADRIRIPTYPHKKSEVSKTDLVNVVKLYTKNAVAAIEGCRFMEAMMTPDDPDKWTVIAVFEGRHMDRFPQ